MTISTITIKLFGKSGQVHRIIEDDKVIKAFETRQEAEAWIAAQ